jgi:repressor LexA
MKLRQLREARSLSQEALGNEMGVSQDTISGWELDKSSPRIYHLKKLADYFGVTIDYLLSYDDETEPA